jgi:aminoglycoside 3-N-acetyltransferase
MDEMVARIAEELLASGLRPGGVALVHSSFRALGPVPGGAETVVPGFLHALGPEGTLLMPALSYVYVNARQPLFDVLNTPSNVGYLPEFFRTRFGTLRSLHPTHSVCGVGPRAVELLAHHELDTTPCGPHSPFSRLRDVAGQVCFLGCWLRPNTSMHAVEEHVLPPYLFGPEITYRLREPNGYEREQVYRAHGFAVYRQRYDRLADLLGPDALHIGQCMHAQIHLFEVPPMWEAALAALRRDPFALVESI